MEAKMVSATSIEVEKIIPEIRTKVVYERTFIEQQIKDITAQRDAYVEQRNIELKECEEILAEMNKQVYKPEEVIDGSTA